jgi:hypothetical protein
MAADSYDNLRKAALEFANELMNAQRKLGPGPTAEDCITTAGYCTVDGASRQMSQCDCNTTANCSNWHQSARPTGSVDWTSNPMHPPPGAWHPVTTIFGQLCEVLAEAYSRRMTVYLANEAVIRKLFSLINEANRDGPPNIGICTLDLTCPPVDVRMTEAQCYMLQGGRWRPG